MLSSSILLSSLISPKPLRFDPFHHLYISKNCIPVRKLESRRVLGRRVLRIGVSDHKKMSELVEIDAFAEDDRVEDEGEAGLGSISQIFGQESDFGGFESTLNHASKWLVAALFGLVILWKPDGEALWAAMGSVVNSWVSVKLKQILNHQRPACASRSDPGMPSSHAQSIFYAAFFAVLSLLQWQGTNAFTVSIGSIIFICGSYLTWLRVSQQLHTVSQVVVGASLGSFCSVSWFWMWHAFVFRAFIASLWVRMVVVLGSIAFCGAFLLYVIQHWLMDDR